MQIFQVRPVELILASFFLEFPDFFASLGFYIVTSLSHQNAQEILNFQLFILKQVYGHSLS